MRNDKYFTYIEKHPVSKAISQIVSVGGIIWAFAAIPVVLELSVDHGAGPGILLSVASILIQIIAEFIEIDEHYSGELITDFFSVYEDDEGCRVEVNGKRIVCDVINKKKLLPYFIREKIPYAKKVRLYRLPDGKYIYIHAQDDKTTIFLNDTIIMENNRIYYDRIDKVYGVMQATPVIQQNVETPATPVYAQTPVVTANEQSRVNDTLGLTTPIVLQGSKDAYTLIALEGQFAGQKWELDKSVMLGRDANCCQIVFAADTAGVSRVHCEVGCKDGSLYIRDLGSSYGTTLEDGQVVNNYQEVTLENSDTFRVSANDKFMVMKN